LLFVLESRSVLISPSAPETVGLRNTQSRCGSLAISNSGPASMHPQVKWLSLRDWSNCGKWTLIGIPGRSSGLAIQWVHEMTSGGCCISKYTNLHSRGWNSDGELSITGKNPGLMSVPKVAFSNVKFPWENRKAICEFHGEKSQSGSALKLQSTPQKLVTAQKELLKGKVEVVFPWIDQAAREKLRLWKLSENK